MLNSFGEIIWKSLHILRLATVTNLKIFCFKVLVKTRNYLISKYITENVFLKHIWKKNKLKGGDIYILHNEKTVEHTGERTDLLSPDSCAEYQLCDPEQVILSL